MADICSFLSWFDGFAENIKKQPTPEQWARIKSKVLDLEAAPEPRAAAPAAPAAPALPVKPRNEREWRVLCEMALQEEGCDPATAGELMVGITPDMAMDPYIAARAACKEMLPH